VLKLYYAPRTCALASHIALEKSGGEYVAERVDFNSNGQRTPEYLRLNPKGRVPALATGRGVLTENPAILLYIAQSFPKSKLAPLDDPFALAQAQAFNSYMCSTVHIASAHRGRGYRWADDEQAIASMKRKVKQNMIDCFTLVENEMLRGPWVMGDAFSICDPYLFTMSGFLEGHGIDVNLFPKVAAQMSAMQADPAVQRVLTVQLS
jgi:glutathione S-transferase